jgi:hypothetical protein
MTLQSLFTGLNEYSVPIFLIILAAPWIAWILCSWIPGRGEEPWVLSVNLGLATLSMLLWSGYLAYATNTGGWQKVVGEANILLLAAPPYYAIASIWVSRQRMALSKIPAFKTLQGIALMAAVYLVLSWLSQRIYIVFFSYMPFSAFLWILAGLLLVAYLGYRRVFGNPPPYDREK